MRKEPIYAVVASVTVDGKVWDIASRDGRGIAPDDLEHYVSRAIARGVTNGRATSGDCTHMVDWFGTVAA